MTLFGIQFGSFGEDMPTPKAKIVRNCISDDERAKRREKAYSMVMEVLKDIPWGCAVSIRRMADHHNIEPGSNEGKNFSADVQWLGDNDRIRKFVDADESKGLRQQLYCAKGSFNAPSA